MFSAIDVRILLEALERRVGVELPRNAVEAPLTNGVLHIRFEYPKSSETYMRLFQLRPCIPLQG